MQEWGATFSEYSCGIQPGRTSSSSTRHRTPTHILFKMLLECLNEHNVPTLVVDELDQLHIFKTHLSLAGFDTKLIDETKVIKIGAF